MKQQDRFNCDMIVLEDGNYIYIAFGPPGSADTSPVWQVMRYDESLEDKIIGRFADGDDNFDNLANDLTSLDYGD